MIRSRRFEQDPARSCARCKHLKCMTVNYKDPEGLIVCEIDAEQVPDIEVLTITTCDKFEEVRYGKK